MALSVAGSLVTLLGLSKYPLTSCSIEVAVVNCDGRDGCVVVLLEAVDAVEGLFLHELVHAVEPLVVLLEPEYLLLGQPQVLLLKIQLALEVVVLRLQLAVERLEVFGEGLVVLKVPLERGNLSVPEVELVLLRALGLAEHVDFLLQRLHLPNAVRQLLLQVVDLVLQHLAVGVEGGPETLGLFLTGARLNHLLLQLGFLTVDLLAELLLLRLSTLILLLEGKQLVLGLPQQLGGL
uniref:Secreted protein n=1 Tax=Strombidium rassoulzadegani TaxID=1082188 RepID=A0A7S3CHG5_9SPIT|mmetsp:Transcript_105/g.204  ORF Transcript_105/g.204 Transcript_105/m.204 type:complete len:236 (+) Transcript_105:277-984(+)